MPPLTGHCIGVFIESLSDAKVEFSNAKEAGVSSSPLTKALLTCGAVAGPLFLLVVLIQDYTRVGFDPRRHPLSMLALGDWGWIQIANFVITGSLNIAGAVGLWRSLRPGPGGTGGPILMGVYGTSLIIVGVFPTVPAWGYPPGASPGGPRDFGFNGTVHNIGFFLVLTSLTAACFVFSYHFVSLGQRGWGLYSLATGVALPTLFLVGAVMGSDANPQPQSLSLRAFTLLGWVWAALIAARTRVASGAWQTGPALGTVR